MHKSSKVLIVGHNDIMENSLANYLQSQGYKNVFSSSAMRLNALDQAAVRRFFSKKKPDYVFLSSVRSGGIAANQKFPAEFIYENMESQNHVIDAAYQMGCKKLLYLTGSCAYPKESPQPIKEEYLLTGALEPTSEPYSIAKIAGTKLCQSYRKQYGFNAIVAVPTTVYGPGADTDLETAHVIGALIGRFYQAVAEGHREVVIWGSGRPRREFLYVDDFVNACLFLMKHYNEREMINVGCGYDVSIRELARLIGEVSGFKGRIVFDRSQPDGTMRKLMDNSRLKGLGWQPKVSLKEGIARMYEWYRHQQKGGERWKKIF